MLISILTEHVNSPDQNSEFVAARLQQYGTQITREHISKEKLKRMGELSSQGYRLCVFVMTLVYVFIAPASVEHAM